MLFPFALVASGLLLALGIPVDDAVESQPQCPRRDICLTEHCIKASARVFEYMNKEADPCEDFHELNWFRPK